MAKKMEFDQKNPMSSELVKRGSRVGKSMNIGDVDIEPSTKLHAGLDDKKMAELGSPDPKKAASIPEDKESAKNSDLSGKSRGQPVKSRAHAGERAMNETDVDLVATDHPGQRLPSDGLQKITRIQSYFLFDDETNSILSPIEWASTRKPFIFRLRATNASLSLLALFSLALAATLTHYHVQAGTWLLVVCLMDIVAGVICEVGSRRVYKDIRMYAETNGPARRMASHEDVPNDTVGQSILEAFWWLTLLQLIHHLLFSVYVFSYPTVASDHVRATHRNDPDTFRDRYGGDASADDVAGTVQTLLLSAAGVALGTVLLQGACLWLTVKVTTWFEIVQGFVEHVNAVGLVCALATLGVAVKVLEYQASMPSQVSTPSMTPVWVLFAFALACVPLSVLGFFASWTEHRVTLRVYAALAGVAAAGFLFLFVYVAAFVDYGDMVGADSGRTCKQVLTFVHEDWWGKPEFVDCKK
jgi:hypothetical protein